MRLTRALAALLVGVLIGAVTCCVTACQTMEAFGKDVSAAARAVGGMVTPEAKKEK